MSMLGLSVGTTPRVSSRPLSSRRGRMSLAFEPITSRSSGMPQARATQPESTLPKLPVGTANASARPPSAAVAQHVVGDLRGDARPVDRVHRREAGALAQAPRRRTAP